MRKVQPDMNCLFLWLLQNIIWKHFIPLHVVMTWLSQELSSAWTEVPSSCTTSALAICVVSAFHATFRQSTICHTLYSYTQRPEQHFLPNNSMCSFCLPTVSCMNFILQWSLQYFFVSLIRNLPFHFQYTLTSTRSILHIGLRVPWRQ